MQYWESSCAVVRFAAPSTEHAHPGYHDWMLLLGQRVVIHAHSELRSHTDTLVDSACEDAHSTQAS